MASAQPQRVVAVSLADMTERLELLSPQQVSDGGGGKVTTLMSSSPQRIVYGALEYDSSRETAEADQNGVTSEPIFRIWHRDDITHRTGIKWRGRIYNITGIGDPTNRRRVLRIQCQARDQSM